MDKILDLVTGNAIAEWLLIAVIVVYFIYKEGPDFVKRISSRPLKEQKEADKDRTVESRLDSIEKDVKEIKAKLERDYDRINDIDSKQKRYSEMLRESLREREIIMEGLLGALGGLQEMGANGPTREAETKIRDYLNERAHKSE